MLKAGLVGLGFMGTSHFNNYIKLMENKAGVKLVAIADIDEKKFSGSGTAGNLDSGSLNLDLSPYTLYNDMVEMIKKEDLDYVDLCLPTYLHAKMAIEAMENGVHVFCEKPMAISSKACQDMIDASRSTGKICMIGHTLRYWNVYEYAKECIEKKTYGEVVSGYFFRGGQTPIWSFENWLLTKEKSGGCLLDQHVHDVDAIHWLFGMPYAVTTSAKVINKGNGYDIISTNYLYEDGKVINAQDDWTINGDGYGFKMLYRINFEKGALNYENGKLTVHPVGGKMFEAQMSTEDAYYKELRLFIEALNGISKLDFINLLESHKKTIELAEAEIKSADSKSSIIRL